MTLTTPRPPSINIDRTMSKILDQDHDDEIRMQVDSIEPELTTASLNHDDEYSDFAEDPEELEIIDRLLEEVAAKQKQDEVAPLIVTDIEDYEAPRGVRLPKVFGHEATRQWNASQAHPADLHVDQVIRDESEERRTSNATNEGLRHGRGEETPREQDASEPDTRSPLERFRRPPKKPLSVTDLISPAWCELQYFYVLTKHGRKRRTPAMKQGSVVHQALEDEVHVTVPVTVTKKEDSWGLRIWNIIQGLRTLRETGRTRELEVWGTVGGELVNGVIDELSYDCPDPKLEEQNLRLSSNQDSEPPLPEYQASIRDYLVTSENRPQGRSIAEALSGNNVDSAVSPSRNVKDTKDDRRIYITDVKTRGSSTMPTGSSIRPTIVQLHLYHHMLESLAQGHFVLAQLATRYNFDVHETFSDEFIAQIGNLNQDLFELAGAGGDAIYKDDDVVPSTQDSMDILLQHNNLETLWEFMMSQFRETFILPDAPSAVPQSSSNKPSPGQEGTGAPPSSTPPSLSQLPTPPSLPTRLSPLLTARYISTSYHTSLADDEPDSKVLGTKSVIFNPSFLKSYLYETLAFWRGERDPKGVEVRDAWKCRVCEFRDGCTWIHERNELAVREAEERRRNRQGERAGLDIADGGAGGPRSRV